MAQYLLVADFPYRAHRFDAGYVFSDEAGDDIADLLAKGAPIVPRTAELEALATRVRASIPDAHAAAVLLAAAGGARALRPETADGAVHVYANASTGLDTNDGLTSTRPLRTLAAARRRMDEWLHLGHEVDAVIDAVGDFNENLHWNVPVIPKGRLGIRGPRDSMIVVASGTLTAASATLLTDSGAAFGSSNAHARLLVRTWDPNNIVATQQWKTIRTHTGTAITPVGSFGTTPQVGWSYQILRPALRILGDGTGKSTTVSIRLPWAADGEFILPGHPSFFMQWTHVGQSGTDFSAITIRGGGGTLTGVVVEGASISMVEFGNTGFSLGGVYSYFDADPIFGLTSPFDFSSIYDAGLGIKYTGTPDVGALGVRVDSGAISGPIVVQGTDFPIFAFSRALIVLTGGASFKGRIICAELSRMDISSTTIPFASKNSPSGGVEYRGNSVGEVSAMEFEAITNAGIYASKRGAMVELHGPLTEAGTGVLGYGLDVQQGCLAHVDAAVSLVGNAGEIRCDAATGTFASLGTAPIVGANSGARAWR